MPKSYQTILDAWCQNIGFLYFLQAVQVKWRMSAKVKFFQLGAARWKYPENTLAGESIYMGHSSRQGWRVGSIKIFHAIFSIGHLSLSSKHRAWLHQIDDAIFLYLPKEPPLFPLTPFPPGLTQHLHLRWCEEIFQGMYSRTWERADFFAPPPSAQSGCGEIVGKTRRSAKTFLTFCQVLQFPRKVTRDGCSRRVMDSLHPNQLSSKWFPFIFVMT